MANSKLRERFEAWHTKQYGYCPKFVNGKFDSDLVEQRYVTFKAALEPVRELVGKWGKRAEAEEMAIDIDADVRAKATRSCIDELAKLLEE